MSFEPRLITSLQNPTVKFVRALELRKERRETGLFVAEGVKVIATARDLGWQPVTLIYEQGNSHSPIVRDLIRWGQATGADCFEATPAVLGKLSTRDNPQTLVAVFRQRWSEPVVGNATPWVALEDIRDPGNLGTIIRTVDATGAAGVILIGDCCDPYSREAARASMGSIFGVRLARMDRVAFLKLASEWQGEIIGTHLAGSVDYRRAYGPGILLVMGSEGPGLSDEMAKACTALVKIPMQGTADSLNLGIATSLMLYEMQRDNLPKV